MRKLPHQQHDVALYTSYIARAHDPAERCEVTKRSLLQLRKIGERLTVDRINPKLGYVAGNMQLLTEVLNEAKGAHEKVPQRAINHLLKKLWKCREDQLSGRDNAAEHSF